MISGNQIHVLVLDEVGSYSKYKQAFLQCLNSRNNSSPNGFQFEYIVKQSDSGDKAICRIKKSHVNKKFFSTALIDVNRFPREDCVKTVRQIRKLDRHIELMLMTDNLEYAHNLMKKELFTRHKMIYIQKPFLVKEICYFIFSLTAKWLNERFIYEGVKNLETIIKTSTEDLVKKNQHLLSETRERKKAQEGLNQLNENLEKVIKERTRKLEETNTALRIILEQREKDRNDLGDKLLYNVNQLVKPYFEKLKQTPLNSRQKIILDTAETNLDDILSPFLENLITGHYSLTPTEIKVAKLVADGKTNKEISELFGVSIGTILTHRHKLRLKLGLKNKKINLRNHLSTLNQPKFQH
jgi:DNA-binding CsgD family transcriptional regulator